MDEDAFASFVAGIAEPKPGALYVRRVPRSTLRELSVRAARQNLSREAYVRELIAEHTSTADTTPDDTNGGTISDSFSWLVSDHAKVTRTTLRKRLMAPFRRGPRPYFKDKNDAMWMLCYWIDHLLALVPEGALSENEQEDINAAFDGAFSLGASLPDDNKLWPSTVASICREAESND